jgi:hypothetical protein
MYNSFIRENLIFCFISFFGLSMFVGVSVAFAGGPVGPFLSAVRDASQVQKYHGAPVKNCVRIDLAGDSASPGLCALFPVVFSDMKLISDTQKRRYGNYGLPPEGWEFALRQGCYELVQTENPEKPRQPRVVSYQVAFPPFSEPLYKNLLRAANPGVYSDLKLDEEIGVFGVTCWGLKGKSISSLLRLPFQSESTAQVSSSRVILLNHVCEPPNYKPEKFQVSGVDIALGQGLSSRGMGQLVFDSLDDKHDYKKELMKSPPEYDQAVDIFFTREICSRSDSLTPMAQCIEVSFKFNKDTEFSVDLTSLTGSSATTKPVNYRLSVWPFMESSGYLTHSSFSEPGFRKHKGEVMVYLTPLSLQDGRLISLALEKEMIRALRTRWLLHGLDETAPVASALKNQISESLHESLLRMGRPLWENLALTNAFSALEGGNTLGDISKPARIRLNNNISDSLQKIMRPDRNGTFEIDLDDQYEPSYPFLMRTSTDGWYNRAVYESWKNWGPAGAANIKNKTVEAVITLLSKGFTRNTKVESYKGYGKDSSLLDYESASKAYFFESTSPADNAYSDYVSSHDGDKFQGKYGWDVLKSNFTDLEWIAQSVEPLDGGALIPEELFEHEDSKSMVPLFLPFWHARKATELVRLADMVRGRADDCPDKVVAVDGLPWSTNEADIFCYINDAPSIERIEAICNAIVSDPVGKSKSPAIPSTGYEYVTTFSSDPWIGSMPLVGDEHKVLEARSYYQHVARKSVSEAIQKLKEESNVNSVGIVKSVNYGYINKMGRFVTDWDSGSFEDLNTFLPDTVDNSADTSASITPTVCRLIDTINDFIDKTRYLQEPYNVNKNSWKAKNELYDKLKREVFIKPSLVPQALWKRYLQFDDDTCQNGYKSFKSFIRRFTLAACGLSSNNRAPRKVTFIKEVSENSFAEVRP